MSNKKKEVSSKNMKNKKVEDNEKYEEEVKEKSLLKKYFILIFIFFLFMGLVLYLCKWYKVYDDYKKDIPVIRDTLFEIKDVDLDHYILDNPSTIIYMCTASDELCRSFEKDFKKLVVKEEYTDDIIYLNLTGLDQEKFVSDFNNKYNFKIKLNSSYPALVVFEDGKVDALLQGNDERKITVANVKSFLELNKIGE